LVATLSWYHLNPGGTGWVDGGAESG
jgi:hypothetical protein